MKKLLLRNGTIVSSQGKKRADVLCENGKIVKVAEDITITDDMEVIDCEDQFILPGVIDTHVHLREPGGEEKEDFITGSKAAARGGVTTVLDMPNNSPMTDSIERLEAKYDLAEGRMVCNYGFYIAATGENFRDIKKAERAVAVKLFMAASTGSGAAAEEAMEKVFEICTDKTLVVHAEDQDRIENRMQEFADQTDPSVHSLIRDEQSAYLAVKKALHLAKKHETKLHIAHISTAKEVESLRKFHGENVTAEAATHHLFLTTDAYSERGTLVQINPPLREVGDKDVVWDALKEGVIDNVITDHAPHTLAEKERPYGEAPSGVPGLETLLPLMLNAVNNGELTLERCCEVLCEKPVEIFGLRDKGFVRENFDADLTVVDMGREEVVGEKGYHSKCGWSPYDGWKLMGWPVVTVVGGEVVMRGGSVEERMVGRAV